MPLDDAKFVDCSLRAKITQPVLDPVDYSSATGLPWQSKVAITPALAVTLHDALNKHPCLEIG